MERCSIIISSPSNFYFENIEVSKVKLLVILNSFQATILPVFSLHLSILNLQSLKLKRLLIEPNILGNSLVFVQERIPSLAALLHP